MKLVSSKFAEHTHFNLYTQLHALEYLIPTNILYIRNELKMKFLIQIWGELRNRISIR